jgi:hypothetical protein
MTEKHNDGVTHSCIKCSTGNFYFYPNTVVFKHSKIGKEFTVALPECFSWENAQKEGFENIGQAIDLHLKSEES